MTDHRRPNDHLVEPLFGGLEGAGGETPAAGASPPWGLLVVLLAVAVAVAALVRS